MMLGKVVGSVWGGKETRSLGNSKLLQVQPVRLKAPTAADGSTHQELAISADGPDVPLGTTVKVVMDTLGAGVGEYVLVAHGSRVRDLTVGPEYPTKEVVIAIVDSAWIDFTAHREVLP